MEKKWKLLYINLGNGEEDGNFYIVFRVMEKKMEASRYSLTLRLWGLGLKTLNPKPQP